MKLFNRMYRAGVPFLFLVVLLATCSAFAQEENRQARDGEDAPHHRLVFLGDRGPHQPRVRAEALVPVMRDRGIEIEYTEDADILASPKLAEYDGLILYANIDEITPEQEQGLLEFVEGGKGFIPLHCASFCFRNSDKFIDLVGAQFQRHGAEVFATRLAAEDQPVFNGFGGFESWDETYIHHRHNDRDRIVLEYRDQGPQARGRQSEPWTWIRVQGDGRIFYTAWGHDLRTWNNPGFQNLVERGIRWACNGDVSLVPDFERQVNADQQSQAQPRRFVPPAMVVGSGSMDALEYDDVGPKVPHYAPGDGGRERGKARNHHAMQRPLSPEASQTYFVTPEEFELELVAAEPDLGPKPVAINWDERGRLWVCETVDYPNELKDPDRGRDRIRICEDTDDDGKPDKFTVFAENLSIPTAMIFYRGGVIVQNGTETIYLKDTDGDDRADLRKTLITGWNMGDTHGGVSNFQYGLDNWIWAMQGYNSSSPRYVDADGNEHEVPTFRQGFWRFKLDQHDPPHVVDLEHLRSTNNNTWGLGISEEGLVFGSTANGNPSVFMPLPNRYYERVRGWSPETLQSIADTAEFAPVTDKIRQVDNFGAYTAGAGHALYTARAYPEQWWNQTAFVCGPTGHLVGVFVLERDGAGYRSSSPMNLVASRDEWTAPIMAEVGPDGNVWVLDWYNYIVQHNPTPYGFETGKGAAYETDLRDKKHGRIYRLKYTGDERRPSAAPAALDKAGPQELVAVLRHPTKLWRLHAQRLLVERGERDVVPALVEMVRDETVDEIGLNVGAIHAIGTLRGLGALEENAVPEAVEAVHAALAHPSPGVRRNAIMALPVNERSRDVLLASKVLDDADVQAQLAAVLALADLPPSSQGAEKIAELLAGQAGRDRWMRDALTSAAATHGVRFLEPLLARYERGRPGQLPRQVAQPVRIVAEHLARSGVDGSDLAALLAALVDTDARLSAPVLEAFATYWPDDREAQLPAAADGAVERLLTDAPFEARGDLLRLARLWNAGNTAELQQQHSDALRAAVTNEELSDEERLAAAQAWVRFDPVSDDVCRGILGTITTETPQSLLTGMLRAASESRSGAFGEELVELYATLLPQGREAVLEVLLEKTESTKALLDAIANNQIEVAALSLEQIAALRSHPVEQLRTRAMELIAERGATPNPDREAVLNELVSVTETTGNAVRGRELFTQHCAVCHLHSGVGATIGPELTGMFVHPKLSILTNIIDPSRDVESNFRSYSVIANGKVYTGMFAGQSRTTVTIVDSAGESHVVQRDEIEDLYTSEKSLMPDGFEKTLSQSDLADVLEFLATPQQFVPLRLDTVANFNSEGGFGRGRGRGRGRRGGFNFFELADWKPRTVHGVPFTLIDPQDGAVRNMLMFPPADSFFGRGMAREVKLACGLPARRLHLLSGVSMGGYPDHAEQSTSLIVRLHFEDGHTEDHELKNGVHFADFREREEVPGSKFAFDAGRRQMRYLAIEPQRRGTITEIEFIKADDPTTPIVLAVTAELE